ncbi:MAG: hypothetical protein A4E49_00250 [Methanosaeta sp. PtaU1.Bin112]|nr:MAG: hypothetical protein A4E49_00250 [Methanosaeta sp. PtaU1.Bin112]
MGRPSGEVNGSAAFPEISQELLRRFSIGELCLRQFGTCYEDLAIDFELMPRPVLEIKLVSCCTMADNAAMPAEDFFLELDLATRIQCLLTIAVLGEDLKNPLIDLRCKNPDCRQEMEVELPLSGLWQRRMQDDAIKVLIGDDELAFRRPTGSDQLCWLSRSYQSQSAAMRAMAETLAIGGSSEVRENLKDLDDDAILAIGKALKESDPLVSFDLHVRCPDCDRKDVHSLDLAEWSLKKLRQKQDSLIDAIHALAYRYHWTEEQIARIPHWRRSRYLSLIEKEEAR